MAQSMTPSICYGGLEDTSDQLTDAPVSEGMSVFIVED